MYRNVDYIIYYIILTFLKAIIKLYYTHTYLPAMQALKVFKYRKLINMYIYNHLSFNN